MTIKCSLNNVHNLILKKNLFISNHEQMTLKSILKYRDQEFNLKSCKKEKRWEKICQQGIGPILKTLVFI